MTSTTFSLNTENLERVSDALNEINSLLADTDRRVLRLIDLLDTKLQFPALPTDDTQPHTPFPTEPDTSFPTPRHGEIDEKDDESGSESDLDQLSEGSNQTHDDTNDYLRYFLDTQLKCGDVAIDESRFEAVENPQVKQLLIDNYRLLKLRRLRRQANATLWSTVQTYQKLLDTIIIPTLMRDVGNQSIDQITLLKTQLTTQSVPEVSQMWDVYQLYIKELEEVKLFASQMTQLIDHLQSGKLDRMAMELDIVQKLLTASEEPALRGGRELILK